MATKKSASSTSAARATTTRKRTTRRPTAGSLTPRRRASRPGLPTTVGTALGTLVVTTLLDLSWPVRLGLIALVVVIGLAYVVHRNRATIMAGAATPADAVALAKETGSAKFNSTVEVALKLGVDPRKADQMVRGTVILPHGTGKTARVIVFATGPAAEAAIAAGADEVGGDELIEKVAAGYTAFDSAVSTPELMGKVGRLGKVLGPRGLMPNPKTGTVTPDVAKAVSDIKGGKIEFRVDKHSNVHFVVGKASFSAEQLNENIATALEEIVRLKPSSSKGRYIMKGAVSTTFGPGIPLDVNSI